MLEKLEHVCQDVDAEAACYAKPCVSVGPAVELVQELIAAVWFNSKPVEALRRNASGSDQTPKYSS